MPTGGGKSLCYQIPAIARQRAGRGVSIVVSPLIALMHDQVGALHEAGVEADFLNSTLTGEQANAVEKRMLRGEITLLYAAPERVTTPRFLALLARRTFRALGRERQFTGAQLGWNSGVLGLPAAAAGLLPDVFALTDAFFAGSGWFTSEQLAFSLALPLVFTLQRSDQYVYHYWGGGQKKLLDAKLARVLTPAFSRQPLAVRLAPVRSLTRRWQRYAEVDKLREGALYALGKGRLLPGAKYTVKALWRAPFGLTFPWRVVRALLATS